jgi:asparagine synthase (glutamine-hydrolysing)
MCGIAGILGAREFTSERLPPMLDIITHRGPDDFGEFFGDDFAFGMRRLSIIDIAGGHQPMWTPDGRYGIVFNGEIYNFLELRSDLELSGCVFSTRSDTEVVLQLFAHHGFDNAAEALNRLRGMFGVCIVDLHSSRMILARDHFGIKPLYYRWDSQSNQERILAFGSEIKSILTDPRCPREVHIPAVINYLSFQYNPLEDTFFQGIRSLTPGHFLDIDMRNQGFTKHRYWRYEFSREPNDDADVMRARVREILEDSVEHHLISDVPVGAFLSGGIDSAITVTLVQERRRAAGASPVKTFTIGFHELGELAEAREVADALGTDHHEIIISSDEYLTALPAIAWMFDEPVADPSEVALYFLSRAAREHVTVVLSGEGADELFGGYKIYREPLDLDRVRNVPGNIGVRLAKAAQRIPRSFPGRNYLRRVSTALRDRFIGNAYVFSPTQVTQLLKDPTGYEHIRPYDELVRQRADFSTLPESRQMQLIDIEYWLRGDILAKADRMTMAHSLELRVPYLDAEVAKVSSQVSDSLKYRDSTTKWILRRAFHGRVPQTTENRAKLGFPTPLRLWLSADPDAVLAPIRESSFISDFMDTQYIERLALEHAEGVADHSRRIFVLLMLALWHKAYFTEAIT